jgi:tetratricopeptide (TPR) repeat protein
VVVYEKSSNENWLAIILSNLSETLRVTGALHDAELSGTRALRVGRAAADNFQEGANLYIVGLSQVARGLPGSDMALRRSLAIWRAQTDWQGVGLVSSYLAQWALWNDDASAALRLAQDAWKLAKSSPVERDVTRAARVQGQANEALGNLDHAEEALHHALMRARASNDLEEELPALTALASLHRRRGDVARARELLDDVWQAAERGPYPLLHADARNALAEIEIHDGNKAAAIEAATMAYKLAWCDGPPFAYDYGLRTARKHLQTLDAPEPEMPPYDPSKHEPIEEIPIDPPDEPADQTAR